MTLSQFGIALIVVLAVAVAWFVASGCGKDWNDPHH